MDSEDTSGNQIEGLYEVRYEEGYRFGEWRIYCLHTEEYGTAYNSEEAALEQVAKLQHLAWIGSELRTRVKEKFFKTLKN